MSTLETRGNGFCLTGRARWEPFRLLVEDRNLMEDIRDRFNLRGYQDIGMLRITVERLDDDGMPPPPPANAPDNSYEGPI